MSRIFPITVGRHRGLTYDPIFAYYFHFYQLFNKCSSLIASIIFDLEKENIDKFVEHKDVNDVKYAQGISIHSTLY